MSTAPASGPRDSKPTQPVHPVQPEQRKPKPALIFDDPLDQQSADDTDRGWGERAPVGDGSNLARFLDEKPPHHV
ncbi:hypothetical protein OH809_25535 [Streptomyces sp. NBC_00873]|uniref:hypothetical protein n=1 Tax=unclassified Streptomyces TaxID=2593676 RepID=UPI00386F26FD|nr:hypothetical protein OH809_25535 [Streptomyces sp. NBC_00873]WTA44361.1 hypothetical protein OH821_18435 [Streptomyces sp. NBC_00842]